MLFYSKELLFNIGVICIKSSHAHCNVLYQAKLAFERLPVPKIYHPFCCGPNNQIIKQLMEETGARINVPPLSVMKDEIVISGEKEAVARCKEVIMNTYEEKVILDLQLA